MYPLLPKLRDSICHEAVCKQSKALYLKRNERFYRRQRNPKSCQEKNIYLLDHMESLQ